MKKILASLSLVAAISGSADGQLMKFLVSTDGVTFSNNVDVTPGQTVQVLVTASYLGTSTAVAGFGSANFQPTISSWHISDQLLPIRLGGNELPSDGSGTIRPQFYTGVTAGSSEVSYGHVQAGYVPGTYGRVLPMGRSYLDAAHALHGFVHVNPDGTGQTYLRIAELNNTGWIGTPQNDAEGGVNPAQLYVVGRTTADPDFWGNRDTIYDPDSGWSVTSRDPSHDSRRVDVELFRFAFTLDSSTAQRTLLIDAPLAGQQGYIGYYRSETDITPSLQLTPIVQTGTVHVVPAPSVLALLGLGCLTASCRRR